MDEIIKSLGNMYLADLEATNQAAAEGKELPDEPKHHDPAPDEPAASEQTERIITFDGELVPPVVIGQYVTMPPDCLQVLVWGEGEDSNLTCPKLLLLRAVAIVRFLGPHLICSFTMAPHVPHAETGPGDLQAAHIVRYRGAHQRAAGMSRCSFVPGCASVLREPCSS